MSCIMSFMRLLNYSASARAMSYYTIQLSSLELVSEDYRQWIMPFSGTTLLLAGLQVLPIGVDGEQAVPMQWISRKPVPTAVLITMQSVSAVQPISQKWLVTAVLQK